MAEKILRDINKVRRHGFSVLFVHWTIALSTIALVFSGFGQMPIYKRYWIADIPGMGWAADYSVTILIHYVAAMFFLMAVAYHIVFHLARKDYDILPRRGDVRESVLIVKSMLTGGKEPPCDKYLAEQRLAYAFIGLLVLMISITGVIKVIKNLPDVFFSPTLLVVATNIHTFASMLLIFGILAHLAAFAFKANRALIPGMFTGKVDLDYCRRRHNKWYERLQAKENCDADPGRPA